MVRFDLTLRAHSYFAVTSGHECVTNSPCMEKKLPATRDAWTHDGRRKGVPTLLI